MTVGVLAGKIPTPSVQVAIGAVGALTQAHFAQMAVLEK